MYRSPSSVLMRNNTPTGTKNNHESTEPERLSSSSSSTSSLDRLVQKLSRWFLHKTAAFYTEECACPSLFHSSEVSQGSLNQTLNIYCFISDAIFKNLHMHNTLVWYGHIVSA